MRYFIAAIGLLVSLALGPAAVAGGNGWGNASNGSGYHHQSNG
jgi:hypothetical protein